MEDATHCTLNRRTFITKLKYRNSIEILMQEGFKSGIKRVYYKSGLSLNKPFSRPFSKFEKFLHITVWLSDNL